jgi:hypothetical protein
MPRDAGNQTFFALVDIHKDSFIFLEQLFIQSSIDLQAVFL